MIGVWGLVARIQLTVDDWCVGLVARIQLRVDDRCGACIKLRVDEEK